MLKFTKESPFLDSKIGIGEILEMKIQMIGTCFDALFTHGI
jgi:hypothetical protein